MERADCLVKHPSLAALQRWLQAVITHPAGVEAGMASDDARREIAISAGDVEAVILPSRGQSSVDRLAVYGNAYYLRLLECLRELFPCLTDTLGRDTFDQFAVGYLQRNPPHSYTLQRLADRFVDFLHDTQPAQDAAWAGFVIDLARLEVALEQVFDGLGPEADPWPHQMQRGDDARPPPEAWPPATLSAESRLLPTTGLTLLEFQWPVSSYYTQWKHGDKPSWPQPAPQHVALFRRDYIVRRHELSPAMFELLTLLVQGLPVGEAVARGAASEAGADWCADDVRTWMTQWVRDRFFIGMAAT